jgi:hypothetical protein
MQKDEEVGKVAQATPVVICTWLPFIHSLGLTRGPAKALELFLAMVVDEAGKITVARNSKKVEAYHLSVPFSHRFVPFNKTPLRKHAVETCEMLDFLKEIVANVPDPSAGGTIALEGENAPKKRGRKRGTTTSAVVPATEAEVDAPKKRRRRKRAKSDDEVVEERDQDEDDGMDEGPSRRAEETWDDDDE